MQQIIHGLWTCRLMISAVGMIAQIAFIHGGRFNFLYRGIYRRVAGMRYTFKASQYINGYTFHFKSILMGYHFYWKSIWIGKMWKLVWIGTIFAIVSIWISLNLVYEWVGVRGSSCPSVPKIKASYPPPSVLL